MKKINLFLLLALAFLACAGLQAQVRIGDNTAPTPGTILDLNSTTKGGLLLSNVSIDNLNKIPVKANMFPGITAGVNDGNNPGFKGAIIYNTNPDIGVGVYVWAGTQWIPIGTNILYDAQGNDYTIGDFGGAGVWMTQNLRTTDSTYTSDGTTAAALVKHVNNGLSPIPYYAYPGTSNTAADRETAFNNDNLQHYGLLYNWVAASGRTDNPNTTDLAGYGYNQPEQYYRGVCPKGWHLPSDYEWIELEKEIATQPKKYSTQQIPYTFTAGDNDYDGMGVWRPKQGTNPEDTTYWGRQMMSTERVNTPNPNGSSFSREKGGFDALLVGIVNSNGSASYYGQNVYFWSSSAYASNGVRRLLNNTGTGVSRNNIDRSFLFSVRCKKD
jgi:uncharacterized protein (TIGR02145 family)